MLMPAGHRPSGLNALTESVYGVLESFVLSPWSVLKVECLWRGVDPCALDDDLLRSLLPGLQRHVARVTDDDNAAHACAALAALVEPAPQPSSSPVVFDY